MNNWPCWHWEPILAMLLSFLQFFLYATVTRDQTKNRVIEISIGAIRKICSLLTKITYYLFGIESSHTPSLLMANSYYSSNLFTQLILFLAHFPASTILTFIVSSSSFLNFFSFPLFGYGWRIKQLLKEIFQKKPSSIITFQQQWLLRGGSLLSS